MENNDRTLKELATPDVVYQPWCIQYRQLKPAQAYELKSGLTMMDRSMIDIASGGALMDKMPIVARHMISNMATISAEAESRATCSSTIWTFPDVPQGQVGYQQLSSQYQAPPFQQQQQQRLPAQGNSPSLEDLMKQLATSNLEFQQSMNSSNMQFQQNMSATIQDLKTQIGQLANIVSHLQLAGSSNLPSQTILNPRGNASAITLKSGKELPQPTSQQLSRPTDADSEPDANSQTLSAKKPEFDEELLKMFQKVEINIPLLDTIKQIPKYAKFLKELCVHKRKKMKGGVESGGIVSALTQNDEFTAGVQQALPKKCRDPGIFFVPCTIGDCTFVDAMFDLGASINVMPISIYKSLKFGDLESFGMTIQLANRSVVQPFGDLEDVLVQVNELIFRADFYVLDIEDKTSGRDLP
ncbi:hypothetical protein CR513_08266, partial [Mucuna pruriens]